MTKTILLVEDDPVDRERIVSLIKLCGCADVVAVATGYEALELLLDEEFVRKVVVLFLDLCLPDLGGVEVLAKLRREARTHRLPVVVMSQSTKELDLWLSYKLGANAYITKPDNELAFSHMVTTACMFWADLNRLPPDQSPEEGRTSV